MLFGSDGPQPHPGVELCKIKALGLSAQDEALALGGNVLRLIDPAAATPRPGPVRRPVATAASGRATGVGIR